METSTEIERSSAYPNLQLATQSRADSSDRRPGYEVGTRSSAYVKVNSAERSDGHDSDFSITLNLPPHHKFTRVALEQISIPKTYYLIEKGWDTFTLRETDEKGVAFDVPITFPEGNCSYQDFTQQLVFLLNKNSPRGMTYVVNFNKMNSNAFSTGKYYITVSNTKGGRAHFVLGNALAEQLGMRPNTTHAFSDVSGGVQQLKSEFVCNFEAEETLLLHSSLVDEKDSILQAVFANYTAPFTKIVYVNPDPRLNSRKLLQADSNTFTFRLTDENNLPLNIHGQNLVFTLIFF